MDHQQISFDNDLITTIVKNYFWRFTSKCPASENLICASDSKLCIPLIARQMYKNEYILDDFSYFYAT